MSNGILLAGDYRKLQSKTLAAAQTPYPGMLLKMTSAGTLTVHTTSGGPAERLIAIEDALQGGLVSDAYTAETVCDCALMAPGSESQVLIVAGEDIAIGDLLMSNGDGKFAERTSTNTVLCIATEACDLSASGAIDTLCNVRWI